jgi:hypothetical protein
MPTTYLATGMMEFKDASAARRWIVRGGQVPRRAKPRPTIIRAALDVARRGHLCALQVATPDIPDGRM